MPKILPEKLDRAGLQTITEERAEAARVLCSREGESDLNANGVAEIFNLNRYVDE